VPDAVVAQLEHFGFSAICNVLAAIKTAKLLDLGPDDALVTVATDGAALYPSAGEAARRRATAASSRRPTPPRRSASTSRSVDTEHMIDCTEADRRRIFNLGYYTWVEQQGATPQRDHVLVRRLDAETTARWPTFDALANPFTLYRDRWRVAEVARRHGLSDDELVALIEDLDARVEATWGVGFRVTPIAAARAALLGPLSEGDGRLWLKDETRNVSGSHKARHLFGVMLQLLVAERVLGYGERPRLAIASCGNAALAAAVVARAAEWPLAVYIPPDAAPSVMSKLRDLDAELHVMERDGEAGDPCYRAFRRALADGALPFCCQGPDNGLCVEGGQSLGYELVDQLAAEGVELDCLLVQIGGGALASACVRALSEAHCAGRIARLPRLYTVQTQGAAPLARAHRLLLERFPDAGGAADSDAIDRALAYAAGHRGEFMWPWEQTPRSVAHGILDDETYDWLAIVEGMLRSGGAPLVVDEATLTCAHGAIEQHTEISADATGTSGFAGWLAARQAGLIGPAEQSAVLVTGVQR
jgi:threonine synthase